MKYWYIFDYTPRGEPIWRSAQAYGFRRKNGMDQVFVRTTSGFCWIFATPVKEV
jgi:hypothetical protein